MQDRLNLSWVAEREQLVLLMLLLNIVVNSCAKQGQTLFLAIHVNFRYVNNSIQKNVDPKIWGK